MEQERPYTEAEPETAAGTAETVTETAETAAEAAAPKKPREPFFPPPAPRAFRRLARDLLQQPRAAHPHVADRGVRAADRRGNGYAVALNPVYWIGTGLLMFWCVGQLFDRRPARHSVGAVVLYFIIAVMIGVFAVQELLGA